jgi:hypothetical protein
MGHLGVGVHLKFGGDLDGRRDRRDMSSGIEGVVDIRRTIHDVEGLSR